MGKTQSKVSFNSSKGAINGTEKKEGANMALWPSPVVRAAGIQRTLVCKSIVLRHERQRFSDWATSKKMGGDGGEHCRAC